MLPPAPTGEAQGPGPPPLQANLLGPFSIAFRGKQAGPWRRPSAKRLCQLVLVSPGRRITRESACEALFSNLAPASAAKALSEALSMGRAALSNLGDAGHGLLQADRTHIWANPTTRLEVDLDLQEERLRSALVAEPGTVRDDQLVLALADEGTLLEDEPVAEWTVRPRERLDWARQEARLTLARDRARGLGRSSPETVVRAWEACLSHDLTSEEAAGALLQIYGAQKRHALVEATYNRCRAALEQLGLRASPALEEVHGATISAAARPQQRPELRDPAAGYKEERRLVTVLLAELAAPLGSGQKFGPEELRELVGGALARVVAHVEALGGTVTSVSGAGLAAIFGAPVSHEDDPERALRAAFRAIGQAGAHPHGLSVRAGVETGEVVVGPLLGRGAHYGAFGEVVGFAAALQSVARPGAVLVGPTTRAAAEGSFYWGPTEEVVTSPGAKPLVGSYLERPKPRPSGHAGRRGLASSAPLVGRGAELSALYDLLREAAAGKGSVVLVIGEAGLGKTRLVNECRKLFMAWVGAGSGRLPLWLEGRAASYASSTPYGLYQQLLAAWLGVIPEDSEEVVRAALQGAMKAVFAGPPGDDRVDLLLQVIGVGPGQAAPGLARLAPEQLQRATFEALRALVSRLLAHGPTVLVLEDLHWADPTSLRLTEELSSLAKAAPLLLVLTRRPEPDPGVSALEAALGADEGLMLRRLELSPLASAAERELARSLLGEGTPYEVVDAVSRGAEGNPLFLEERLFALLETNALVRDDAGWRLDHSLSGNLPAALERLFRSRVDRLGRAPHDAIVAASVLGPEFGLGVLRAVTDLDGGLTGAVSELCSGGLLVELRKLPEPAYRFRHGLIQEATYQGLLRDHRRSLHARAAWALEEAWAGKVDEVAGVLGHHFAMAGEVERAAHYLELAGDRAASTFANDEAVASYRYALDLVDQDRAGANAKPAIALRAKLARVFFQIGRHAEARHTLHEALGLVSADDRLQAARLHALLGRVEIADHHYDAAMSAFDAANELLGERPEDADQAIVDLWLEVQLDGRVYVHYWLNEPTKAAAVLAAARPVVEARATRARRQTFHFFSATQLMRESRYRTDDEILGHIRAALAAAAEGASEADIAFSRFFLGFALLWQGDLVGAREHMEASLAIVDRIGDLVLRARCLCYLNVTALRRHDVGAVRSLAPQALAAGEAASYPEYVAAAIATQAWGAWRDEKPDDVVRLASEALELWGTTVVSYSWYWLCLWPLIAVQVARGDVGDAVGTARKLLPAPQQRLPEELEALVETAIMAWEKDEPRLAGERLFEAVELAERLRYA